MGSKDASQKIQSLGAIKKWQVWFRGANMQNGGKPSQNRPPPAQNRSKSKFSSIFQQSMNRNKYAYMVLWVKQVQVPAF